MLTPRIEVSPEEATAELDAVLASTAFVRSPRLARLLAYLCTKYLSGEADQIKEYNIGVEVLERPANFDPATDAGARVEVHRLRRRLQKYYETEGASRKFRIVIPVGHYVPTFAPNLPETPYGHVHVEELLIREPEPAPAPAKQHGFPRAWLAAAGLVLLAGAALLLLWPRKVAHSGTATGRETNSPMVASITAHAVPTVAAGAGSSVRLSCGRGVPYTDRRGQVWMADRYFQGGTSFDAPRQYVARASDPRLFQYGRTGDFSYQIPLPKGNYELRLGFAETAFGPSTPGGGGEYSRTFDVRANGRTLLDDFDIYSDANGTNIADIRVFKDIAPAEDGLLHLDFHSRRAEALVNTIELEPEQSHRLNPIRIVAQENFVTLGNGTVWAPDADYIGGQSSVHTAATAGNDPDLFTTERYGHFEYALPAAPGTYGVSLYFAEKYFGAGNPGGGGVGSRVFDVFCNGAVLLRNFDILKEAGSNHELVKSFHGLTPNAQGKLILSFVPVRNYASLYSIEVEDETQ